jgi:hypothetical protein
VRLSLTARKAASRSEGGLAPLPVECHSASGGKPPFLTLRCLDLSFPLKLSDFLAQFH